MANIRKRAVSKQGVLLPRSPMETSVRLFNLLAKRTEEEYGKQIEAITREMIEGVLDDSEFKNVFFVKWRRAMALPMIVTDIRFETVKQAICIVSLQLPLHGYGGPMLEATRRVGNAAGFNAVLCSRNEIALNLFLSDEYLPYLIAHPYPPYGGTKEAFITRDEFLVGEYSPIG